MTGNIYQRAREYSPRLGRFLQRDPLGYPDAMNTYAAYHVMYGGVDPSGELAWKLPLAARAVGGFIGKRVAAPVAAYATKKIMQRQAKRQLAQLKKQQEAAARARQAEQARKAAQEGTKKCPTGVKELTTQQKKAIRSYEKQIDKHQKKLDEFKANPTVRPGMEKLPQEVIKKQQQERIKHLENEIKTFKDNIEKIRRGDLEC